MVMRERLVMLLMELAREIALPLTTLGNVTAAPFSPPGQVKRGNESESMKVKK